MPTRIGILILAVLECCALPTAFAETSTDLAGFWVDSSSGVSVRVRYEQSDDNVNEKGTALTGRIAGFFQSGAVMDWTLFGEIEHVSAVDSSSYDDGGTNGVTGKAVIADPASTEINQLFARYNWQEGASLTLGRHKLGYRESPLQQRYLGPASFRQNEQTVDGITVAGIASETVEYQVSYLYNINRIFGEDNPISTRANFELSAITGRAAMEVERLGNEEGFYYRLDFEEAFRLSAQTIGGRFSGETEMDDFDVFYAVEFASQSGIGDNPSDESVGYSLAQIGMRWPEHNQLAVQVIREALGGGGTTSFSTPVGTIHAFQGWTDKFLATPIDGVVDTYLMATTEFGKGKFLLKIHDFRSDEGSYGYGSEWGARSSLTLTHLASEVSWHATVRTSIRKISELLATTRPSFGRGFRRNSEVSRSLASLYVGLFVLGLSSSS